MRMQSWKLGLHSTTPAAIINKGHMLEMDRKPMALWFHTLSSSAFTTHILQHLFICFCYWEVQWLKWAEASTFIEFRAVNDLDMMLAKSTLCADNNNLLIIFTFIFYFIFYFYFCCCCWRGEWNSLAVDGISCCRTALLPEVSPNWCKSDQNPDPAYSDGDYLGSKQSYLCQI